jgi:glycosyltransferase involved in cell wall biosynthesis
VGSVVRLAVSSGLFERVLVVDDASTDATAAEAEQAGATVLRQASNMGKARAMQAGLEAGGEPVVCFLDADLIGVSQEHLAELVNPVARGTVQATLGVFRGGRFLTSLAQMISPMISGQRCLRRELLAGFNGWSSGYGIETAINSHLKQNGVKQRIVYWEGAAQIMKEEKWGAARGGARRWRMYWEILRSWLASRKR